MKKIVTLCFLLTSYAGMAQSEMKTSQGFLFIPTVAFHSPMGDMADRFENFSSIGLQIEYKTKSNWILGVDYEWLFGDGVKPEGIFSGITGPSGAIIDVNGDFGIVNPSIRGNYATVNMGRLFNLSKKRPNSGILFSLGAGFMQHRIDFNSSEVTLPQVNGEYEKGYDKLTYGFATKQFLGYQFLESTKKIHVRGGFEFNQGFTQGRRTWDFDANKSGLDSRFDGTIAFKIGLIVPIYTKGAKDEEFFID